eukprot:s700_g16.t1
MHQPEKVGLATASLHRSYGHDVHFANWPLVDIRLGNIQRLHHKILAGGTVGLLACRQNGYSKFTEFLTPSAAHSGHVKCFVMLCFCSTSVFPGSFCICC